MVPTFMEFPYNFNDVTTVYAEVNGYECYMSTLLLLLLLLLLLFSLVLHPITGYGLLVHEVS
jgi:hypothetical protein